MERKTGNGQKMFHVEHSLGNLLHIVQKEVLRIRKRQPKNNDEATGAASLKASALHS